MIRIVLYFSFILILACNQDNTCIDTKIGKVYFYKPDFIRDYNYKEQYDLSLIKNIYSYYLISNPPNEFGSPKNNDSLFFSFEIKLIEDTEKKNMNSIIPRSKEVLKNRIDILNNLYRANNLIESKITRNNNNMIFEIECSRTNINSLYRYEKFYILTDSNFYYEIIIDVRNLNNNNRSKYIKEAHKIMNSLKIRQYSKEVD